MNVRAEDLMLSNHGVREEMEWTPWRSNQSIIKEINPEYSLERVMLKLKLQNFGHPPHFTGKNPGAGKD